MIRILWQCAPKARPKKTRSTAPDTLVSGVLAPQIDFFPPAAGSNNANVPAARLGHFVPPIPHPQIIGLVKTPPCLSGYPRQGGVFTRRGGFHSTIIVPKSRNFGSLLGPKSRFFRAPSARGFLIKYRHVCAGRARRRQKIFDLARNIKHYETSLLLAPLMRLAKSCRSRTRTQRL